MVHSPERMTYYKAQYPIVSKFSWSCNSRAVVPDAWESQSSTNPHVDTLAKHSAVLVCIPGSKWWHLALSALQIAPLTVHFQSVILSEQSETMVRISREIWPYNLAPLVLQLSSTGNKVECLSLLPLDEDGMIVPKGVMNQLQSEPGYRNQQQVRQRDHKRMDVASTGGLISKWMCERRMITAPAVCSRLSDSWRAWAVKVGKRRVPAKILWTVILFINSLQ